MMLFATSSQLVRYGLQLLLATETQLVCSDVDDFDGCLTVKIVRKKNRVYTVDGYLATA